MNMDMHQPVVDNVFTEGTLDGEVIWNIVLAPETVNGLFSISTKTRLEKSLSASSGVGKRVDVFSTIGWETSGEILIDDEVVSFDDKNVTQFVISKRGSTPVFHAQGSNVYSFSKSIWIWGITFNIGSCI